ncbi:MAG: hypothetical protein K8H86_00495 [Ignavibacteriaceae bacterium]|nr:hypothetical protein [Ignavibacteriaceae bacterium]
MVKILRLLFFIFIFSISSFAQQVTAKAYTDTTDYLIGDRISYKVKIVYPENVIIVPPNFADSIHNVDVLDVKSPLTTKSNGNITCVYEFVLSRFDSSDVTIPGYPIRYKKKDTPDEQAAPLPAEYLVDTLYLTAVTNPVTFTVHTMRVLKEEGMKDIKEPITIPLDPKIVLLYILLGLGIIFLTVQIYIYVKYKRRKKPTEAIVPKIILPPHVKALKDLVILDDKHLWQQGEVKEYHSEITGIIRRYFEERYRMPALELSTSEVLENLKQRSDTEVIRNITRDFLNNADLVKFAKFTPMNSVNEDMMVEAKEIVKLTEFVPIEDKGEEERLDV